MVARKGRGASLADVARVAGVSAQTVSRVANGSDAVRSETRERVLAAMRELDYRPSFAARSLKSGRYHCVGVAMSGDITATGHQYQLEGIIQAASEASYAVTCVHLPDDRATLADATRLLLELPVDGFVIALNRTPDDFSRFEPPRDLPCVLISPHAHPLCRTVDTDQQRCSEEIVRHLVQEGRREIRFVAGRSGSPHGDERLLGWQKALEGRSLTLCQPQRGDWTATSGYEAGAILAEDPSCDAIYACNDAMAMGVIAALRDAGRRVPEDVAVVGVDDSLRGSIPKLDLTTYRFDNARVSRILFDEAMGRTEGYGRHELVPGRLVLRGTA